MPTIKILTVTDLHRVRVLYEQLGKAVASHRPDIVAFVGDFLDLGGDNSDQFSTAECAEFISKLPCAEIVFTRGNHEDANWREFFVAWQQTGRVLNALHRAAFRHGPLVMVGFPCLLGNETAFATVPGEEDDPADYSADYEAWLPDVLRPWGEAARTLWLMHEPPAGSPLTRLTGVLAGNPEWVTAIEHNSPWLTISGHDHVTPRKSKRWHHRIAQTVCVNAGQSDSGPLHYCLIQAEFAKATPSLPVRMQVRAWPYGVSVELPM
jgi:Icc-related predicted phosphoesterase